ncbi:hypothetical protein Leryth_021925 [Lithospermum erythrorhizon]|nr:hypothetical protein Leryth_021925 [Lithospermum erythrorhizon]
MNSLSPSALKVTKAKAVLAPLSKQIPSPQTPFSFNIPANMCPNSSSPNFPTKAESPPRRVTAIATLAGAPPGAFRNPGASDKETPDSVGTKSISISPKLTIRPPPLLLEKQERGT